MAKFQHTGQTSHFSTSSKQDQCFDPTCKAQMQSVGATVTNMHVLVLLANSSLTFRQLAMTAPNQPASIITEGCGCLYLHRHSLAIAQVESQHTSLTVLRSVH